MMFLVPIAKDGHVGHCGHGEHDGRGEHDGCGDPGGGPDLMMFLVPIAKDARCTMTVEYSSSTIDLEKKSKINLSTWPPLI